MERYFESVSSAFQFPGDTPALLYQYGSRPHTVVGFAG
jgi:hypothetical protein